MRYIFILCVLAFASTCFGLAEVTKVVDPDNGGGTDYTSLDAWEDALGGTTTGHLPNDDQIAIALCRSSGTDDTTAVDITGWTTDGTRYIEIRGTDFPADGIFDDGAYVLYNNDADTYMVQQREDYVRIRKIQFRVTGTESTRQAVYIHSVSTSDIYVDSCIFYGSYVGVGAGRAIQVNNGDATVTMYNCTVYGFISGGDTGFIGIHADNQSNFNIYNCTVYNCYNGIKRDAGTCTVKNTAIFNCTDDINATVTASNCATEDGYDSGNNGNITITQGDPWTDLVTNPAVADFSVKDASSELYDAGAADIFDEDDDIMDTARPQGGGWDIGAYELIVAPPAGGGQFIMITALWYSTRERKAA